MRCFLFRDACRVRFATVIAATAAASLRGLRNADEDDEDEEQGEGKGGGEERSA